MMYQVFNSGDLSGIAHGYRSVIALAPGRKWITLVDWATLETARVQTSVWERLRPVPQAYKKTRIRAAMKRRLQYVTATAAIKEAMRSL